jgi:hypothetical protein
MRSMEAEKEANDGNNEMMRRMITMKSDNKG